MKLAGSVTPAVAAVAVNVPAALFALNRGEVAIPEAFGQLGRLAAAAVEARAGRCCAELPPRRRRRRAEREGDRRAVDRVAVGVEDLAWSGCGVAAAGGRRLARRWPA